MAVETAILAGKIGAAVKRASMNQAAGWWYSPHMAAASRAIAERIPLVDLVLEVRDARVGYPHHTPCCPLCLVLWWESILSCSMKLCNSIYIVFLRCQRFALLSCLRETSTPSCISGPLIFSCSMKWMNKKSLIFVVLITFLYQTAGVWWNDWVRIANLCSVANLSVSLS